MEAGLEPREQLEERGQQEEDGEAEKEEEEEEGAAEEEDDEEEEGEYVFLDLDDVYEHTSILANTPYVLSGLDTLNPVLAIGDNLKLIGEYVETIGTCYIFSESDSETVVMHQETGPSEANLFKDKCIVDPNQVPSRQVKPITGLQKILKFRMATDDEIQKTTRHNSPSQ